MQSELQKKLEHNLNCNEMKVLFNYYYVLLFMYYFIIYYRFNQQGISPKLEFSTTTVIKEIYMPYNVSNLKLLT